jgi:methylthioribulose-1-phosphate dehydratase
VKFTPVLSIISAIIMQSFEEISQDLINLGRQFYSRGWVMGTSGNLSAVLSRDPLRLAITASGAHKGTLSTGQILQVDGSGAVVAGSGRPSAETRLHLAVVNVRGAAAVLHTHSVWSTILSEKDAGRGGVAISGYEMLKGLEGVASHENREWLPIIENSQDTASLAESVRSVLERRPDSHGFLLRRHGLYTWGRELSEAARHVEILEFLLEVLGRSRDIR